MNTELIYQGRTDIAHRHLKLTDAPIVNGRGRLWRPDGLSLEWSQGQLTSAVLKGCVMRNGNPDHRVRGRARWRVCERPNGGIAFEAAGMGWEPHDMPGWLMDLIMRQEVPPWSE